MSKKYFFIVVSFIAFIGIAVYAYKIDHNDRVVATINGKPVYESEVKEKISQFYSSNAVDDNFSYDNLDDNMKENLIRSIVIGRLMLKDADNADIENHNKFKNALKLEIEQLKQRVFLDLKLEKYLTENLIKAEYDAYVKSHQGKKEYKLSQILFDNEQEANKIYEQINKTGDFDNFVKENKDLKSDLSTDFISEEQLPKEFIFLKDTNKGSYSKPIKTDFGWHIVKLLDVKPVEIPEYNEMKNKLKNNLTQRFFSEYMDKLIKDNNVEITIKSN